MNYKVAGTVGILLTEEEVVKNELPINIGIDGNVLVSRSDGKSYTARSVDGQFTIPNEFLINAKYTMSCGEVTFATFLIIVEDGKKKAMPFAASQSETARLQWKAIAGIMDVVEKIKQTCELTIEKVTEFSDGYRTE